MTLFLTNLQAVNLCLRPVRTLHQSSYFWSVVVNHEVLRGGKIITITSASLQIRSISTLNCIINSDFEFLVTFYDRTSISKQGPRWRSGKTRLPTSLKILEKKLLHFQGVESP